jgi:hypothetical protein
MRHPDGSSTEQRAGPSYQQAIRMAFPYFGHNLNELPRSRAAKYQKAFSSYPDAEHRGILWIKKISQRFKQALITGLIRS